jgi:hypothetical protein
MNSNNSLQRTPSYEDSDLEFESTNTKNDIELGMNELYKQLEKINKEISKRNAMDNIKLNREKLKLENTIKEFEKNRNMSNNEFMELLKRNNLSVTPLKGSFFRLETVDPETGKMGLVETIYNNEIRMPIPTTGLRHRPKTPDSRSVSPFIPIPFDMEFKKPLLPTNINQLNEIKRKSICEECLHGTCPESCKIMGGIRRGKTRGKHGRGKHGRGKHGDGKQTKRKSLKKRHQNTKKHNIRRDKKNYNQKTARGISSSKPITNQQPINRVIEYDPEYETIRKTDQQVIDLIFSDKPPEYKKNILNAFERAFPRKK